MSVVCSCRKIKDTEGPAGRVTDTAITVHFNKNPKIQAQNWREFSCDLTGEFMRCGRCEQYADALLDTLRTQNENEVAELSATSGTGSLVPVFN